MSDLIERLQGWIDYSPVSSNLCATNENGRKLMTEAIAALSPVLPVEVVTMCSKLRYWKPIAGTEAADLIERLALSLEASQKRCIDRQKTLDLCANRNLELEQRIEELEKPVLPDEVEKWIWRLGQDGETVDAADLIERLARENVSLDQQGLQAKEESNHWQQKCIGQQQRIEELEHLLEVGKAHKKLCVDKCKRLDAALAEIETKLDKMAYRYDALDSESAELCRIASIARKARAGDD